MARFLKYEEFFSINEGGAFGHLSHPYEDHNLTFGDLKEMITISMNGSFDESNFVEEKTDGQNLMFTWKGGDIRFARNKSHLKNEGDNALSLDQLVSNFEGRGEISRAFEMAAKDLRSSISGLSGSERDEIFGEGQRFVSVEVIYPETTVAVPYGMSMLVFHGAIEHDVNGVPIELDKKAAKTLAKMIEDANLHIQKEFFVRGPNEIKLEKSNNNFIKAKKYVSKLNSLMKRHRSKDIDTLGSWYEAEFRMIFEREISRSWNIDWNDSELQELIVNRLFRGDKSQNIRQIKAQFGDSLASNIKTFEAKQAKVLKKRITFEMETLFLSIGADILQNVSIFLAANPTKASMEMKSRLEASIADIRSNKDPDEIEKLEYELNRLEASGGLDKIVPSEGITFMYKNKLYKYTGLFASIHQINSIISFRR